MTEIIKNPNKAHLSSMTIGQGHVIMLGNVPEELSKEENVIKLSKNFFSWNGTNKEKVESFGLFGSDIDYNTFYPDLDIKDLKPSEEEFINPMFRLLSATIVSKNYNPTDFSEGGVLKASMPLLLGQTVNCDHETNIGNAIGSVSKVFWQEAYKDTNGFIIPAGINGILKIDGKANPRIARGILMDPPSIHSNSVTVQFKWDKSHPDLSDEDFYEKLGTYDKNGLMIRRVVTEVVRYFETSLVSHGADVFAQKIGEDGKIINPTYAQKSWSSYKEYDDDKSKQYFFMDIKQDTDYYQEVNNTSENLNENNTNLNNKNNMNKELEQFLASLFGEGMLTLGEGKEITMEEALSQVKSTLDEINTLKASVQNLTAEKTSLSEEVNTLKAEKASLQVKATLGDSYLTKLKTTAIANYRKVIGDSFDEKDPIYVMLSSENITSDALEALNNDYTKRLAEMYPMKCNHCGSKDVSRASSVEENEDKKAGEELSEKPQDTATVVQALLKKQFGKVNE